MPASPKMSVLHSSTLLVASLKPLLMAINSVCQANGISGYLYITIAAWLADQVRRRLGALNFIPALARRFYFDSYHSDLDMSYSWIQNYLNHQSRYLRSTNSFAIATGQEEVFGLQKLASEQSKNPSVKTASKAVLPSFTPMLERNYWFVYERTVFRISRETWQAKVYRGMEYPASVTSLCYVVRCFSQSKSVLLLLLAEAKKLYEATRPPKIMLRAFNSGRGDFWDGAMFRPKRDWTGVVLDEDVKRTLRDNVREFLDSERWYASKALNWTMGILLHGPPGTGKTSSVSFLPDLIYPYVNAERKVLLSAVRTISGRRCILLIEDVGAWYAAFKKRQWDLQQKGKDQEPDLDSAEDQAAVQAVGNSVSLSTLLQILDGVENMDGVIVILTTNHLEGIDPALLRPAQFDKATQAQAKLLFESFFAASSETTSSELRPIKMHDFSSEAIASMATAWSEQIKDGEFSHAQLQGSLLGMKKHPEKALQTMPVWLALNRQHPKVKRTDAAHPSATPPAGTVDQSAEPASPASVFHVALQDQDLPDQVASPPLSKEEPRLKDSLIQDANSLEELFSTPGTVLLDHQASGS